MKKITHFQSFSLLCLFFTSAHAQRIYMYDKTPPAEEMADTLYPELSETDTLFPELAIAKNKKGKTLNSSKRKILNFGSKEKSTSGFAATSIGMPVNFNYDSYELQAQILPFINELGVMMNLERMANHEIIIEGHTDAVGTATYNINLSNNRALAVKRYLMKKYNIASHRLIAVGKGESQLLSGKPSTHSMNRRVVFTRAQ